MACGYREVSLYNGKGERALTARMARMARMLQAKLRPALKAHPLRLVEIADGAKDNWTYLAEELPAGDEVVD